ncbi:hypothetical protein SHI21_18265 [Bacteriovorax sp. PP10]|uniref:Uncharacterized protein n=1 Tax=Bacteriovorax antarcticus TaxID=3088717 RepID=A0ABU5W303_9BACT|nr:hypothetical protein [Bacteriovorax sp. PP10]MEA9358185.1 hypothetical protein [Bacteriovorax sp. PP10]
MKLTQGIQSLSESGLNIFLSTKVSSLPEDLFPFSDEQKNKTLCLIGNGGKALWEKLPHPLDTSTHPFDLYVENKMQEFAEKILEDKIEVLYPNYSYTLPLQKLGRALNLCTQSPIGLDIHSEFGLWFAFRGVFLTSKDIPDTALDKISSPCETCLEKPCLTTSDIARGRLCCPIKKEHQYLPAQIDFHQNALSLLKL